MDNKPPLKGGTGENTPFAGQSRKKERDNGHDNPFKRQISDPNLDHCLHLHLITDIIIIS